MTTIKANSLSALLSAVPSMLGHQPRESLVALPMQNGRTIGAMRFDLPTKGEVAQFSLTASATILRTLPHAVLLVVYSEDDHARHWTTIEALDLDLGIDVPIAEAAYVSADGYGSMLNTDAAGPLSDIVVDPKLGHVAPSNEPEALPRVDVEAFAESAAATESAEIPIDLMPIFTDGSLQGAAESDIEAGLLAVLLAKPSYRDVFLATVYGGMQHGERAVKGQAIFEGGGVYPQETAVFMWGEGEKPNAKRMESALAVARRAAAGSEALGLAGAHSVCAWLSWALGRSTHALWYAERAIEIEPDHGLSSIILTFVDSGHLPAWAFSK